jgi:hypothetical protein
MDDLALRPRRLEARDPRHVAFEHQDRVGRIEIGRRVIAEMAGMVGRQRQMARPVLHHRGRKAQGEIGEGRDRRRVAPGAGGDNQRVFGRGEDARGLVDTLRAPPSRSGGGSPGSGKRSARAGKKPATMSPA